MLQQCWGGVKILQAQQTLTVYDESSTNDHVPAYIYYWDDFTRSQFVIPADSLSAMSGGTISAITFYTTSANVPYTSVSTADVYLKEITGGTLSGFVAKSSATVVYSGTVNVVAGGSGGMMTITFATPFTYNGGYLLVGIENTTDAGYKNIAFYGKTVAGASGAGSNASSLSDVTFSQQNFIPKTTFTYSGGGNTPVEIGGVSASSNCVPIDCNYKNTVSQFIYTASEIGGACDINSIAFYHTDTPNLGGGNLANDRTVEVYFTLRSQSDYSVVADWVDVSSGDLVLSADITVPGISSGSSWFTLNFDEPYHYYGSGNLVVTIVTHSDTYEDFHYFMGDNTGSGSAVRSLYKRSDNDVYSIASLPSSPSSTTFRPCVKLGTSPYTTPVWDFGDTMAYCGTTPIFPSSSFSMSFCSAIAVKYPASMMAGRHTINSVNFYAHDTEHEYMILISQEENGSGEPINAFFSDYFSADASGWINLPINNPLDDTKPLWVIIETNGNSARFVQTSVHEGNAQYVLLTSSGNWMPVSDISSSYSWMSTNMWPLYAITSASYSAPVLSISGPASGTVGTPLTFDATVTSGATCSWTLTGATPATATGNSVTAIWNAAGTYNVICTATANGLSSSDTLQVSIIDCSGVLPLPFSCGFESDDNLACWTFVDADGDNYNWQPAYPEQLHNGAGSYVSASYEGGPLSPDNWMITPKLHIPAEGATLQWLAAAQDDGDFEEVYSVQVSTTTTETSAFTTTIYNDTIDHGKMPWDSVAVSLSQFAGQDIYIAFRHYNCTDQFFLVIDDISVYSGNPPAPEVSIDAPATAPSGSTVTFTAEGPATGTYVWSFPGGNPGVATTQTATTTWAEPGTYTVSLTAVIDGQSATASHTITITDANAVSISGPSVANAGTSVEFTAEGPATGTYVWAFQGGEPAAATGSTVSTKWNEVGTYTVTLTAVVGGQTATASHTITISNVGIGNVEQISVSLAPNPTTGVVSVSAAEPVLSLEVYTLQGSLLQRVEGASVDLGQQPAGVYLLRVVTAAGCAMQRVAVMR